MICSINRYHLYFSSRNVPTNMTVLSQNLCMMKCDGITFCKATDRKSIRQKEHTSLNKENWVFWSHAIGDVTSIKRDENVMKFFKFKTEIHAILEDHSYVSHNFVSKARLKVSQTTFTKTIYGPARSALTAGRVWKMWKSKKQQTKKISIVRVPKEIFHTFNDFYIYF